MADAELLAAMDRQVELSLAVGFPFADEGLCRVVNEYIAEQVRRHPGDWRVWPGGARPAGRVAGSRSGLGCRSQWLL